MTMKDFMTAVIAAQISDEMTAFAEAEIQKLEARAEKRRTTPTKAQLEAGALLDALIAGMVAGEPVTSASIAAAMEISPQKATSLLRAGVATGRLTEIGTIKGKSGKVKAYALPEDSSEDSSEG